MKGIIEMNAIEKDVNELVFKELNNANKEHPLFNSPHQGYAVIKEEIEETMDGLNMLLEVFSNAWSGIKKDEPVFEQVRIVKELAKNVAVEALQVAAMCDKFNMSLAGENADHCVCCGEVIPEGYGHTCYACRKKAEDNGI